MTTTYETRRDDDARTVRLMTSLDRAAEGPELDDDVFVVALLDGLVTDKAAEAAGHYPPAGHGYPRKGADR